MRHGDAAARRVNVGRGINLLQPELACLDGLLTCGLYRVRVTSSDALATGSRMSANR